jgi:hypothetical protein
MELRAEVAAYTRNIFASEKATKKNPTHSFLALTLQLTFFVACQNSFGNGEKNGFFLPQNVQEVTFKFHRFRNLILLPVTINDSVHVNLILDTGCRNILLFGRRFEKLLMIQPGQQIRFSGLGDGNLLDGKLSLSNKVSIQAVLGENLPIIVVASKNLFSGHPTIHGIIGYDIFTKFEIEFNYCRRLITFRSAAIAEMSAEFTRIPLRIEDSRPFISSKIFFSRYEGQTLDLMLDTGSALGLLLKSDDAKNFPEGIPKTVLGQGLNGNVLGREKQAHKIILETFEIRPVFCSGVTSSNREEHGSVGMDIMKKYTIVLNYCKGYAGFKNRKDARIATSL